MAGTGGAGVRVARRVSAAVRHLFDHREEDLDELDRRRSDRHDPDRREDAEDQREHHLDAGLGRRFFSALPALGAQRLGVHAQRLRDAGAELVGLNQHRDERRDIVDAGAVGEIAQRVGARLAGAQLEVDQPQLVGQILVRERQLFADALQRLVEAEARFDADHEQVERVGQRQPDPMLPLLGHPRRARMPGSR